MKYIKTYEKILSIPPESGVWKKFLYPVHFDEIADLLDYFKKLKVDFKIYENNPKFQKMGPAFAVKDCLIFFEDKEDKGKVDHWIKNRSFMVTNKTMGKFVGQKVKDVDLYIDANKYNL